MVLGWPLNSFLTRRAIRISKGLLAARDKRMGVLNELIGAVRPQIYLHKVILTSAFKGQIHQVLRMGGPVDRTGARRAEEGDRLAHQVAAEQRPVPVALDNRADPRLRHRFLLLGGGGREGVDGGHGVHSHRAVQYDSAAVEYYTDVDCAGLAGM